MRPEDKERWLTFVAAQIQQAETAVSTSGKGIIEAAETSNTKEDPFCVWDALQRSVQKNGKLRGLKEFLKELQGMGPTDKVEPGAQIRAVIDCQEQDLLVMWTKGSLPDIAVFTPKAPAVSAIMGKQNGFSATYEVGETEHTVQILEIH